MNKHTPGPWQIKRDGTNWVDIIPSSKANEEHPISLANIYTRQNNLLEANAFLMAAAPCLLEELEKAHILLAIALAVLNPTQTQKVCALSKLWTESDSTRATEREEVIRRARGEAQNVMVEPVIDDQDSTPTPSTVAEGVAS